MKGLTEPHVLLAASNPHKLVRNLVGILTPNEIKKIEDAVKENVLALFRLAENHFEFAKSIDNKEWRQRVSRLYYAAYNARRAVQLDHSGHFSTDAADHNKIDDLPDLFPNLAGARTQLRQLRDDRNLADYSHLATVADLLVSPNQAESFVRQFIADSAAFLKNRGVKL